MWRTRSSPLSAVPGSVVAPGPARRPSSVGAEVAVGLRPPGHPQQHVDRALPQLAQVVAGAQRLVQVRVQLGRQLAQAQLGAAAQAAALIVPATRAGIAARDLATRVAPLVTRLRHRLLIRPPVALPS